jgi:hypothetical protein
MGDYQRDVHELTPNQHCRRISSKAMAGCLKDCRRWLNKGSNLKRRISGPGLWLPSLSRAQSLPKVRSRSCANHLVGDRLSFPADDGFLSSESAFLPNQRDPHVVTRSQSPRRIHKFRSNHHCPSPFSAHIRYAFPPARSHFSS